MVGWYDPRVLMQSAYQVAISNIFGRHSDTRLIEALASQPQNEFDYSDSSGDFWFDYVADIGDGWNSTYAIADAWRSPTLELSSITDGREVTQPRPRARVRRRRGLSLSDAQRIRSAHREPVPPRLRRPRAARRVRHPRQSRLVRQPGRVLAHLLPSGARLRRLHDAPDAQLLRAEAARATGGCWPSTCSSARISTNRRCSTSRRSPRSMDDAARLIFCVPEPRWILEDAYPRHSSYEEAVEHALPRGEGIQAQGARVPHRRPAFLQAPRERGRACRRSPPAAAARSCIRRTRPLPAKLRNGFEQRAVYPDEKTSRRLAWRNFLFPFINPKAGWLYAFLYAMSAWLASAQPARPRTSSTCPPRSSPH